MAGIPSNDPLAAQADEIMRALQEADHAPPQMRGSDIISMLERDPSLTLDDILPPTSGPAPETLLGNGRAPRARGELLPVPLPDLPPSPNTMPPGQGLQPQTRPEAAQFSQDAASFGTGANAAITAAAATPLGRGIALAGRGAAAVTAPIARHLAGHPAAYGLGATAGLTAATAGETQPPGPEEQDARQLADLNTQLGDWQKQLGTLQAQRKQTMDELTAQRTGSGGRKAGIGGEYRAQQEGLSRLDEQIAKINTSITQTNDAITQARTRMTPEYRDMRRRLQEADDVRKGILADAPKPFREEYPTLTRAWFAIPIAAGALEAALLRMPKALSLQGQAHRWWEAVSTARSATNPVERANARILAERLEQSMPPQTWRNIAGFYAGPAVAAGLSGAGVANIPEFYDLFTLPAVNPERRAYEEYLKRLPDNHPEVRRTIEMLRSIPSDNPHYQAAVRHFAEIKPAIVKAVEGAIEGIGGAAMMTTAAKAISPWESSLPRAETRALLDAAASRARRTQHQSPTAEGSGAPIPLQAAPQPPLLEPPSPARGAPPRAAEGGRGSQTAPAQSNQGIGGSGIREAWESPTGEQRFLDARGRWQDQNGFTRPPDPRSWRRISLYDSIMSFGGYPVG